MESTVTKFANFIEKSTDIEIPDSTLHSAKLIVADCLGAIVGGMAEPEIRMLAESKGENLFEILDNNKKATDESVSLLFGTAGTVLEMDEGHQFAKGHPGMQTYKDTATMHAKHFAYFCTCLHMFSLSTL